MFWKNFVFLCNQKGVSPNRAAAEMGFSSGTVTWWKKGRTPRSTALQRMAAYFGVSQGDLLYDETVAIEQEGITEEERTWLSIIRGLPAQDRELILALAQRLY